MMYQGGKGRLAARIAALVSTTPGRRYVEPFIGSAAVFSQVASRYEQAIGADVVPDLVMLWRDAANGWVPPEHLSREEYDALRDAEPSALRAFAGFPCSFGGKWWGGYAHDPKSDRNFARAASRSIARRAATMSNSVILLADYRELWPVIDAETVIYADPPYAGTLAYSGAGHFDSETFWRVADQWVDAGATVFVSEYAAPPGWVEVWSAERHTSTALDNSGAYVTDRLFRRG